ncbi:MAG: haloacid dehalogenase type II [Alphaproteobacteria bacterium]|nr:haloacid dehalogenase type II [Alphaproteobacteria bacterium]
MIVPSFYSVKWYWNTDLTVKKNFKDTSTPGCDKTPQPHPLRPSRRWNRPGDWKPKSRATLPAALRSGYPDAPSVADSVKSSGNSAMTTAMQESLKGEIGVLLFDQYGTVVDMQTGLVEAVTPFLRERGWQGEPHRFVTWWRRTHYENSMIDALCDRGHTPYRLIGQRAVAQVMDRAGISYSQDDVVWLVGQIEALKPFPDVIEALERLSVRYKLAILSNGDRDMLDAAKPHIGFPFDQVISVQEAGYFKPHWKTYAKAAELLGEERARILFVANHEFDCVGSKSYGMRAAFIDRRNRPFGAWPAQPDLVVADFKSLADALA